MARMALLRAVAAALLLAALAIVGAPLAAADTIEVRLRSNVRAAPSTRSAILDRADPGERFNLIDDGVRREGFYHIELADGRRGWIYSARVIRHADEDLSPLSSTSAVGSLSQLGPTRMAVHFIDVDQGAAALIEFPCRAIMIDAGGRTAQSTQHLLDYLAAFFARRGDLENRIETIFITHTHIDHNRALRQVVETYEVGGYVHNGVLEGSGRAAANWINTHPSATERRRAVPDSDVTRGGTAGLSDGVIDAINCPGADPQVRILSGRQDENPGWSDGEFENGNNKGLVIRIDFGAASFLFTGDLEEPAIETLVDYYEGTAMLDADVWLVGHHGSANGVTASLLEAMSPDMAIISMGPSAETDEAWTAYSYGHPRRSAVEMIEPAVRLSLPAAVERNVAVAVERFVPYRLTRALYATGWDGDLIVTADWDGALAVETGP